MSARPLAVREADVLVVGAGAAGLSVARGLSGLRVDLVSLGPLGRSGSSPLAQGGIAGALGENDSPRLHASDTLAAAAGLADESAVARLTGDAPARLRELLAAGARFDRTPGGKLDLAREAAHSRARVLHARDATGAELVRALGDGVAGQPGLSLFEGASVVELAGEPGRVAGGWVRHARGELVLHRARAVVLATGGIGQLFARTTNPKEARGEGLALAWRAGARLADLEFVQFHPTALDAGLDPMPLLTEALRGAGALIVDDRGARLRAADGSAAELLPRDVVARLLWSALASGRRALLDARGAVGERFDERFPTAFEACRTAGLDPRREPIPIAPAAHYHMGGVLVDEAGRASVSGLWAAGEVACTGVHGANRLASNSLLEGLVFGGRVACDVRGAVARGGAGAARWASRSSATSGHRPGTLAEAAAGRSRAPAPPERDARVEAAVRALMWDSVGLVRTEAGLRAAQRQLEALDQQLAEGAGGSPDLVTVARLLTTAALARTESRGAHYRADHPDPRAALRMRIVLSRQADGGTRLETRPVAGLGRAQLEQDLPAEVGVGA